MTGNALPSSDHIARYCGGSQIDEDGQIAPTAFHLRQDQDEEYLSVHWLEILNKSDRISEISAVRDMMGKKLRLGKTAKIAILNVGEALDYVEYKSCFSIRILHEPNHDYLSHSGIYDTKQDEDLISELLAEKVLETHPALVHNP